MWILGCLWTNLQDIHVAQDFPLCPRAVLEWWNVCVAFCLVPDIIRSCFLSVWLRLAVLSCLSVTAGATGSCES